MGPRPRRLAIALVALVLLISTSCNRGQHFKELDANVAINNCTAVPDPSSISTDGHVTWAGDGKQIYTVTFTDWIPPFDSQSYSVPDTNGNKVSSSEPDTSADLCTFFSFSGSCSYKYTITGSGGCSGPDPHVIISK
jgi:hypothetical protein